MLLISTKRTLEKTLPALAALVARGAPEAVQNVLIEMRRQLAAIKPGHDLLVEVHRKEVSFAASDLLCLDDLSSVSDAELQRLLNASKA